MSRCEKANAFADEGRDNGDDELVNRSSSRKDPMISPPPIIKMFLPVCLRRRSTKACIDSFTNWTPAGTDAGGVRRGRDYQYFPVVELSSTLHRQVSDAALTGFLEWENAEDSPGGER